MDESTNSSKSDQNNFVTANSNPKRFTQEKSFRNHKLIPRGSISNSCSKYLNQFVCDVCQILLTKKGSLTKQIWIHERNPNLKYQFTCVVCWKKFSCKSGMKLHILIHDSNSNLKYEFNCDICQKKFTHKVI